MRVHNLPNTSDIHQSSTTNIFDLPTRPHSLSILVLLIQYFPLLSLNCQSLFFPSLIHLLLYLLFFLSYINIFVFSLLHLHFPLASSHTSLVSHNSIPLCSSRLSHLCFATYIYLFCCVHKLVPKYFLDLIYSTVFFIRSVIHLNVDTTLFILFHRS